MYKLFCAVLSFCLLCMGIAACGSNSATTASADELTYVSLRINPEIELVIDEDGKVVAVNAINEDGETVLAELALIGMTAENACEAFTSTATELGFIDVTAEANTVYVFIDGEKPEADENLQEKMHEKINGFFDRKGIFGKAEKELDDEFIALAEEWNVSVKDARLVSRILELYPERTVEEIIAMSFEEKLELIKDDKTNNGLPVDLREEYKEGVEQLKLQFSELFELGKRLNELETALLDETLTEDARAILQAELDEAKTRFDELKEQYKQALETLKSEKRERVDEWKTFHKDKFQQLQKENEERLQEHERRFDEDREAVREQIKQWRERK